MSIEAKAALKFSLVVALLLSALLLLPFAFLEEYNGRVVAITDGDTLTLLTEGNRQVNVRLAEIDTPESHQPYGSRSKQELSNLAFGKAARVQVQDMDKYGRTVGRVFVGKLDVNAEMIRRGAAWVYRQYAKDKNLFKLEEEARREKRGLWSLPESERVPPWEWRHKSKSSQLHGRAFNRAFVLSCFLSGCFGSGTNLISPFPHLAHESSIG